MSLFYADLKNIKNLADLTNQDFVISFLKELVDLTGLTLISNGFPIYKFSSPIGVDDAITAFGVLSESHISIHTYPEFRGFHIDIFSCRDLTNKLHDILKCISDNWVIDGIDYSIVKRSIS